MTHHDIARSPRTPVAWAGLAFLAALTLVTGLFVGTLGPLLAVSCDTCQDGVRATRFADALVQVAQVGVPLTTLATVVGIFLPRGGARAGGAGLCLLVILQVTMLILGRA